MNGKSFISYIAILALSFLLYSMKPANSLYYSSLPIVMILLPILAGHRVKIGFSIKDTATGLLTSAVVLFPYYLLFGRNVDTLTASYLIFQLFGVALPEEFFFRGFMQDLMGKKIQAVFLVSFLFALAHLPKAIFLGEWISLLSFFPSLIMGWLYMKTNNILPGTIFHFLANVVQ
jgi:membrane protease YdiL (CAAX protease family)